MARKTQRRPAKSESHAHRKRPEPLAIEMIPTIPAAVVALAPVISWAIGAAWEMIEIPAVTFRNKSAHNPYHCHVFKASPSVKLRVACWRAGSGVQPAGR